MRPPWRVERARLTAKPSGQPPARPVYYERRRSTPSTLDHPPADHRFDPLMPPPTRHVFVCLNERTAGGRPACGDRGGPEIFAALQRAIGARPELWGQVAVTGCRCLGPCFDGPNVVVYPDAVWYAHVTPADAPEIVATHLTTGHPVDRLRYDWGEDAPREADD